MLKIQNLYKNYGKKAVLKGVDLCVRKGEIKGLIGVNGVGKTTLIECVCGVKKPTDGKIFLEGKEVCLASERPSARRVIGYMPQAFGMFNDLSVQENLGYLCAVYGLTEDRLTEIMEVCSLTTQREVLASKLSGGYRQLLSMACAMIHSPKLLILDEPTVAMDPIFRKNFWKIVRRSREEGSTVLFITHYLEELAECDSFACLSDGRVVYDGTYADLTSENVKADALLESIVGGKR